MVSSDEKKIFLRIGPAIKILDISLKRDPIEVSYSHSHSPAIAINPNGKQMLDERGKIWPFYTYDELWEIIKKEAEKEEKK